MTGRSQSRETASRIPNFPDLRSVALHGPCRCPHRSRQEDIHRTTCPHIKHSKSLICLEWR